VFRRHRSGDGDDRWLVVGLGNPGDRYAQTRHNLGAMTLDLLLDRTDASLKSHKSGCLVAEVTLAGERVVLARPTTYMNESGRPVGQLLRFYRAAAEKLIVVHDELDIPFGEVRVKFGGGTAGHNGLNSIVPHLRTKDFARVRVGIGRPGGEGAVAKVLDAFSRAEREELPSVLERAADAAESIVERGLDRTMNEFNTRDT
jgi:peptidyl-tRNA hydrolase, PTH1 family